MSEMTPTRAALAVATMGLTEAGGLRPIYEELTKPPDVPGARKVDDRAVQQAMAEAAARRSRARGVRSTILSQNFLAPGQPQLKQTLGS